MEIAFMAASFVLLILSVWLFLKNEDGQYSSVVSNVSFLNGEAKSIATKQRDMDDDQKKFAEQTVQQLATLQKRMDDFERSAPKSYTVKIETPEFPVKVPPSLLGRAGVTKKKMDRVSQ